MLNTLFLSPRLPISRIPRRAPAIFPWQMAVCLSAASVRIRLSMYGAKFLFLVCTVHCNPRLDGVDNVAWTCTRPPHALVLETFFRLESQVNSQLQSLTDDGRSREEIEGTDINSCKLQHDGKGNLPMKQNECRARAPLPSLFSFYIDSFSFYNRGPEPIIFNAFTILSYSTAHAALASGLVPSSFSRWEICIALITSLLACRARIRLSIT